MAQCDGCADPLLQSDLVSGVVPAGVSAAQVAEHEIAKEVLGTDLGALVPDGQSSQNTVTDQEPVNFS